MGTGFNAALSDCNGFLRTAVGSLHGVVRLRPGKSEIEAVLHVEALLPNTFPFNTQRMSSGGLALGRFSGMPCYRKVSKLE